MLTSTTLSSLAFLIVAIAAWHMARDLSELGSFFPRVIAVMLGVFSLTQLIISAIKNIKEKPFSGVESKRLIPMIIGIVAYLIAMILIGFVPSSILYLSFFFWFLSRGSDKDLSLLKSVTFAVLICGGFYAVFYYIFNVPLPEGLLFDW